MSELSLFQTEPRMERDALVSEDGLYRYTLSRRWAPGPLLPFGMLNPSTAGKDVDDPTTRRCEGFARREGCGGYLVVNTAAFRATKPADMLAAADPVGPDNERWLRAALLGSVIDGVPFVCAWGAHGQPAHVAKIIRLAAEVGARLACLGVTKDGAPRHPLYLRADSPLQPWPLSGRVSA